MLHTPVIYTYSLLQMIKACSLFKEMEKKPFLLLHCWKELCNHPKWLAHLATQGNVSQKKQKLALQQRDSDERIMSMNLSGMDASL